MLPGDLATLDHISLSYSMGRVGNGFVSSMESDINDNEEAGDLAIGSNGPSATG